ncbi:MAG: WD40/YVTN/BNR-like repeat-containing protein [Rhodanobacteraceae bacterium]
MGRLRRPLMLVGLVAACAMLVSTTASAAVPAKAYAALHWRNVGPFLGGRSLAVAGNPATPSTFYAGYTGGGIWKTTNNGATWNRLTGSHFAFGSVGALAVAPSDPNVIYAGTGEGAVRGDMATGDGVYKSTDAGKTWKHVGLADTHVISRIVIDPHNPDVAYAAALGHVFGPNPQRGVYKTIDGGKHWKLVLHVDDHTGAIDVAIDPHNPRVLYAAMWQVYRRPWMLSSGGPGSGLYKSTDAGEHWKDISKNPGLPTGILGKIGVSVSGADSNVVYAIIEAKNGGVFRSDDAGATWHRVYHKSNLSQRAWYFHRIVADPKNVDTVYAPEVAGIFKSTDGGRTFKRLEPPHGDVHTVWVNPDNPEIMISGNDGGASISLDGGKSWSSERNQPTGQFYHVSLDDRFPFDLYGAQQDRGSVEVASAGRFAITAAQVWNVAGGESGFVVPVPDQPWITYGGGYSGALERLNRRTGISRSVDPWPDNPMGHGAADLKYRFQWTYPIMISKYPPHDIYVGSQYVMRSSDEGISWTRISPDLTRDLKDKQQPSGGPLTRDNSSIEYYGTVFALAESPVKQGVLWTGSDDGLVHVSTDGGKHWQDATPAGLPTQSTISIIDPSHFAAGTAFLAARRYRQDDFKPYLYRTTDYGKHWTKITNGLPDDESSFAIRQDTQDKDLLFAGTFHGAYVSFDDGAHWQSLQLNLPSVPVRDIAIQPRANALVIATHGLGFWVLDNLQPLREMSGRVAAAGDYLFTPQTTYLVNRFHFGGSLPDAGENPDSGVVVFYDLEAQPPKHTTVSLTFMDAAGKTIATFSNQTDRHGKPIKRNHDFYPRKSNSEPEVVSTNAGMDRFVWNLRYPDATEVPGAILWGGSMSGPRIVPGVYKVKLTVGGKSLTRDFTVVKNPDNSATRQDFEAQLALAKKIHAKLDATDKAILKLRKARDQVKAYEGRLGDRKYTALKKQADQVVDKLTAIEDALMQTKSHSGEDPLNYPIRLNDKLAALASGVSGSFGKPTQQEQAVYQELATQVDTQLQALHAVLHVELPKLNQAISQSGIPPIALPRQKAAGTK